MADFEESNGEQNGIASRTNPSMFHACSAYAIPLRRTGGGCGTSDLHVIENNQPLHDFREALGRGNEWSPACEDDLRDF